MSVQQEVTLAVLSRRLERVENLTGDLNDDLRDIEQETVPDLSTRLDAIAERLDALARLHDEVAADVAWDRTSEGNW